MDRLIEKQIDSDGNEHYFYMENGAGYSVSKLAYPNNMGPNKPRDKVENMMARLHAYEEAEAFARELESPPAKKVMVTKGLRGRTNPEAYHEACLQAARHYYSFRGETVQILESTGVSNGFDGSDVGRRLSGLGRVIAEELAVCDELVLMDDWQNYDGCRCEHFIAAQYGIKCVYLYLQP
jgi:hypothetical protein